MLRTPEQALWPLNKTMGPSVAKNADFVKTMFTRQLTLP
jgi:hypothetical protein